LGDRSEEGNYVIESSVVKVSLPLGKQNAVGLMVGNRFVHEIKVDDFVKRSAKIRKIFNV